MFPFEDPLSLTVFEIFTVEALEASASSGQDLQGFRDMLTSVVFISSNLGLEGLLGSEFADMFTAAHLSRDLSVVLVDGCLGVQAKSSTGHPFFRR